MNTSNNDFESMGKGIMSKIYPYLITDLKDLYHEDFSSKKILEIGTGPGFVIKELLKENFSKVYGIDISLDMLFRAKQNNNENSSNLHLFCSKAESLPFKSNSLDIIISRGSIFFWKDINKAFKEINRVIKPNGFVLIGGGYGISTPDDIISDINSYYKTNFNKKIKPKLEIDFLINELKSLGYIPYVISKKLHGFWIYWIK
jgi:ubiquinone/menaquinone biosynthesis C-methylase UbiE